MIGADVRASSDLANKRHDVPSDFNTLLQDLEKVLQNLMCLSTFIATPEPRSELSKAQCEYTPSISDIEELIDDWSPQDLKAFVLPIGLFHTARAQCRIVELHYNYSVWTNNLGVHITWKVYLNRLSDLLFAIALYTNEVIFERKRVVWHHVVETTSPLVTTAPVPSPQPSV
jgi:cob(I)alamin adenosyltransferase